MASLKELGKELLAIYEAIPDDLILIKKSLGTIKQMAKDEGIEL
jgi:hypothetical protein